MICCWSICCWSVCCCWYICCWYICCWSCYCWYGRSWYSCCWSVFLDFNLRTFIYFFCSFVFVLRFFLRVCVCVLKWRTKSNKSTQNENKKKIENIKCNTRTHTHTHANTHTNNTCVWSQLAPHKSTNILDLHKHYKYFVTEMHYILHFCHDNTQFLKYLCLWLGLQSLVCVKKKTNKTNKTKHKKQNQNTYTNNA